MTIKLDPFDTATWNSDQKAYFQAVDEAMRESKDVQIKNGEPQHAAYLVHKFLDNAQSTVRIFSGKLARRLDGVAIFENNHILDAAKAFLADRDGTIKVVVQDGIDVDEGKRWSNHPLVVRANQAGVGDRIDIRQATEEQLHVLREGNALNHWMTLDERAYRLEFDLRRAKAVANFGRPNVARGLTEIFDRLFSGAIPLKASG